MSFFLYLYFCLLFVVRSFQGLIVFVLLFLCLFCCLLLIFVVVCCCLVVFVVCCCHHCCLVVWLFGCLVVSLLVCFCLFVCLVLAVVVVVVVVDIGSVCWDVVVNIGSVFCWYWEREQVLLLLGGIEFVVLQVKVLRHFISKWRC